MYPKLRGLDCNQSSLWDRSVLFPISFKAISQKAVFFFLQNHSTSLAFKLAVALMIM